MNKLKPYQVGENDIVLAESAEEAEQLLRDYSGCYQEDEALEVDDLSDRLEMKLFDDDGKFLMTLAEWIKDKNQSQYLFGWE